MTNHYFLMLAIVHSILCQTNDSQTNTSIFNATETSLLALKNISVLNFISE